MSRSIVRIGAPWRTALIPPTTTNSTCAWTRRRRVSLTNCCTCQRLLHEKSPSLVPIEPLGRRQEKLTLDLSVIHIASMSQVKDRAWISVVIHHAESLQ